jgi:signal transduction histidine kinase
VQEALTNTVRHASARSATVVVRYVHDALELEVTDDGRGAATNGAGDVAGLGGPNAAAGLRGPNAVAGLGGPNAVAGLRGPNAAAGLRGPNAGAGHGLVGMRERVALFGGELRVGEPEGGGFSVFARLPTSP